MDTQAARPKPRRKSFWIKQLHTWHWISSAISLVGLLLFTVTGFTLNHAADIEAQPTTIEHSATMPVPLRRHVAPDDAADTRKPLPAAVAGWIEATFPAKARGDAEWSAETVDLALPRPGGDGWISIDRTTGEVTSEFTDRGWISYLNDLHKGRNSGSVWSWFIDLFALASLVFALTGLVLLWLHSRHRRSTWPLVIAGLFIPTVIAVFFIH